MNQQWWMVVGPWECPYTILGSVPPPQWLSKCDVAVGADPVSRSDSVHDSCSALCYGATVLQQCNCTRRPLGLFSAGRRISPQLAKPADLSSPPRCKYLEPANLVILRIRSSHRSCSEGKDQKIMNSVRTPGFATRSVI